jgi:hypothetical protein
MNTQQIINYLDLTLQNATEYDDNDNIPPSMRYSTNTDLLVCNIKILIKLLENTNETK